MSRLQNKLRRLGCCQDACDWAANYVDPVFAWRYCDRGDWLLWLAMRLDVNRADVVLAASACARLAWPHMKNERSRSAVEIVEQWALGNPQPSIQEVKDAAEGAFLAYLRLVASHSRHAANAAHLLATLPDEKSELRFMTVSRVAHNAATAVYMAGTVSMHEALARCADLVREHLAEEVMLAAWEECFRNTEGRSWV